MPRNLIIRFIKSGEPAPRAVATFIDKIPPEEFEEIKKWALHGKGKYAKTRLGTIRKTLLVNIVVTPSEERINEDEITVTSRDRPGQVVKLPKK